MHVERRRTPTQVQATHPSPAREPAYHCLRPGLWGHCCAGMRMLPLLRTRPGESITHDSCNCEQLEISCA